MFQLAAQSCSYRPLSRPAAPSSCSSATPPQNRHRAAVPFYPCPSQQRRHRVSAPRTFNKQSSRAVPPLLSRPAAQSSCSWAPYIKPAAQSRLCSCPLLSRPQPAAPGAFSQQRSRAATPLYPRQQRGHRVAVPLSCTPPQNSYHAAVPFYFCSSQPRCHRLSAPLTFSQQRSRAATPLYPGQQRRHRVAVPHSCTPSQNSHHAAAPFYLCPSQ